MKRCAQGVSFLLVSWCGVAAGSPPQPPSSSPEASRGADAPALRLVEPACEDPPYDAAELRRLLLAEPWSERLLLELELPFCGKDETEIVLHLDLEARRARLDTTIDLYDVRFEERARTLVLALSELARVLSARKMEAEPLEEEQREPPLDNAASLAPDRVVPLSLRSGLWRVEARGSIQSFAEDLPAFLGGGAGVNFLVEDTWILRAAADGLFGSTRDELGLFGVSVLSGSFGADYVLVQNPRLTLGATLRPMVAFVGGEARARGAGSALCLESRWGLEAPLGDEFRLVVAFELGGYLQEARFVVADRPVVELTGVRTGGTVGFVYEPRL